MNNIKKYGATETSVAVLILYLHFISENELYSLRDEKQT